ncbi:hypothetical protein NQD34_009818 [Periophthalmus magnuspinnatus]|nr:hypothetical protein NQD34_009818 [Periophthalmus magnuspinnatus]
MYRLLCIHPKRSDSQVEPAKPKELTRRLEIYRIKGSRCNFSMCVCVWGEVGGPIPACLYGNVIALPGMFHSSFKCIYLQAGDPIGLSLMMSLPGPSGDQK